MLSQHMTHQDLPGADALRLAEAVEADFEESTYRVAMADVLRLAQETGHSAYDCEYVALAGDLGVPLVTGDETVANLFSGTATLLEDDADR